MTKPPTKIDLLLTNARVITAGASLPELQSVAVSGDTIADVGAVDDLNIARQPRARVIDCQGLTLVPGLIDAHCHLLAMAGALSAVDCGPDVAATIAQLQDRIKFEAQRAPPGQWIRASGYDQEVFPQATHPTRHDLDQAAPEHPVRLDHRSRHACVFNSRALAAAGIHRDTPDPVDGIIDRDAATGEPTGLLLEMAGFLRQRLGSLRDEAGLSEGLRRLNDLLLGYGITSVQDAGPTNDPERWDRFRELKNTGRVVPRVTMLAGAAHLDEFQSAGMSFGCGDDQLRLGPAKVMLALTTGALLPSEIELGELVGAAHRMGFPAAIHAIEAEAVVAAADALRAASPLAHPMAHSGQNCSRPRRPPDRIEHCAECPPGALSLVRKAGATVVTQPGFIYWNGDGYLHTVDPDSLSDLYPIGRLARAGVPLAFGSDAPVTGMNPWPAVYSALTRRTRRGQMMGRPGEEAEQPVVPLMAALNAYTLGAATADGTAGRKGSIQPGKLADLALLNVDLRQVGPAKAASQLKDIQSVLTVLGGRVVWNRGL